MILNVAFYPTSNSIWCYGKEREVKDMPAEKQAIDKARLLGINHVALEVESIEEALSFYARVFDFSLRGRASNIAFIDLGDQFINLSEGRTQRPDEQRHFGLVVDDKEKVRRKLKEAGVETLPGRGVEFLDPWGNRIQIVDYANIQFIKHKAVLEALGSDLRKSPAAINELRKKGIAIKED
jgi:lactoylglutathione lyase